MKSVSTKHGGKPPAHQSGPRPGEGRERLGNVRAPEPPRELRPRPLEPRPRGAGEPRPAQRAEEPRTGVVRRVQPDGWRCLEWGQPKPRRRPRPRPEASATKVTIVQLSTGGELLRQNGPDTWLPEAGDFIQRMSALLARGLGSQGCRSLCLKSEKAALALSAVGSSKVVVVSGPVTSMANVLRRVGLQ